MLGPSSAVLAWQLDVQHDVRQAQAGPWCGEAGPGRQADRPRGHVAFEELAAYDNHSLNDVHAQWHGQE